MRFLWRQTSRLQSNRPPASTFHTLVCKTRFSLATIVHAMKKFLLIFMLVMLPLQASWARSSGLNCNGPLAPVRMAYFLPDLPRRSGATGGSIPGRLRLTQSFIDTTWAGARRAGALAAGAAAAAGLDADLRAAATGFAAALRAALPVVACAAATRTSAGRGCLRGLPATLGSTR